MDQHAHLSRREREIMDIVYARGKASAAEVLERISDPPSRASVRTLMRILEEKGHLQHYKKGKEFVYLPTRPRERAARSALDRVLNIFYGGSLERAVAAHLAEPRKKVSQDELKRLASLIRQARERGK